ncbi:MAG: hypothetical protein DRO39_06315 [Thermoprotei archaeon]|nr:MAG: hypothetical protein DRO39_06315 [Thermoprotei archaeon]
MARSGEIPREHFRKMIEDGKVVRTPAGGQVIIYRVWDLLKRNAMTAEAIANALGVRKKTVYNAIAHLKQRKGLKILRYYNKEDGQFYYYLEEEEK